MEIKGTARFVTVLASLPVSFSESYLTSHNHLLSVDFSFPIATSYSFSLLRFLSSGLSSELAGLTIAGKFERILDGKSKWKPGVMAYCSVVATYAGMALAVLNVIV